MGPPGAALSEALNYTPFFKSVKCTLGANMPTANGGGKKREPEMQQEIEAL
jgi:hypothetical protein